MSEFDMRKLIARIKELEKENTNLKQLLEVKNEQKESNKPLHNSDSNISNVSSAESPSTELHTRDNLPSSSIRSTKSVKASRR